MMKNSAIKHITLIAVFFTLIGCTRSYKNGNIPLYRQKDFQDTVCRLQTGDSVLVIKRTDSATLVRPKDERCCANLFSDCENWLPSCTGWIPNTMLDSLIIPPQDYNAY